MDPDLLIVPCRGDTQGKDPGEERSCFQIYVVRLSEIGRSGCRELRPKFVVDCKLLGYEMCIVGSRVYMFDSVSKPGSAVGAFDLSKHPLNNNDDDDEIIVLREEMMRDMAPMWNQERGVRGVRAVPTPGGKILAFSTRIKRCSSTKVVDFELYDPQTDCWEEIPPIQQAAWALLAHLSFKIWAYAFLDDVTFAVDTDLGMQFRLTIGAPHGTGTYWEAQQKHWLGGGLPLCGYSRAIVGVDQELWLTPSLGFDLKTLGAGKHRVVVCQFPMSAFLLYDGFEVDAWSQNIVFEETSSNCFVLETAQDGFSGHHFLQIDEYHLDMVKYFQEKAGLEAMVKYRQEMLDLEEAMLGRSLEGNPNQKAWCAPQLEFHLLSTTLFSLSPKNSLSLPRLAKPPTITRK